MIASQERGIVMMRMSNVFKVNNNDFVALISEKLRREQGLT